MQGGGQMMMNPQLQAKFYAIDKNRSGRIALQEIAMSYPQFKFPMKSAQMLLRGITDLPFIDINTFPMFDSYINNFYAAFARVSMGSPIIMAQQTVMALQSLQFPNLTPQSFNAVVSKFDSNKNGVDFGEFLAICAYILVCTRLISKYDTNKDGHLTVEINGLLSLGLWFF
uniref:EF-hand domain-containing protein n=1 Tax=Trepomonas sp. PC1 TaxID=1076344 RepID=A0A146K2S1_9EUKA|eukprot:JAP91183.1 hypothetical protein TPC1_17277 [Trepomonas sp. PC1]